MPLQPVATRRLYLQILEVRVGSGICVTRPRRHMDLTRNRYSKDWKELDQ